MRDRLGIERTFGTSQVVGDGFLVKIYYHLAVESLVGLLRKINAAPPREASGV